MASRSLHDAFAQFPAARSVATSSPELFTRSHMVGKRIRILRKLLGFKQETLALDAGISQSTISRMENDLFDPGFHLVERILRCMGRTLNDVAGSDIPDTQVSFTITPLPPAAKGKAAPKKKRRRK